MLGPPLLQQNSIIIQKQPTAAFKRVPFTKEQQQKKRTVCFHSSLYSVLCFFFSRLLPFGVIKSWISSIPLASFVKKKEREQSFFFYYTCFLFFFFILSFGFLSSSLRFSSFCTHITRARCFQFFFSFQVLRLAAIIALLPFVPRPFSVFLAAAVE